MQCDALAEDYQLGLILFYEKLASGDIDLIRILGQHREVYQSGLFSVRISCNKIPQGTHGLSAEMSALYDMVIQYLPNSSWLALAVTAVDVIDHRTEDRRIGHLPADHTSLNLHAAQKRAQLLFQQSLYFAYEICALIVKHLRLCEGLDLLVLAVPAGRIHYGKRPSESRRRLF